MSSHKSQNQNDANGGFKDESSGCSSHFATLNNVTQGSQPSQPPPRSTEFQSSEDINRSVQLNHTTMNTPSENVVAPHLTHNGSSTQSSNVFWNSNGFRFPQVNETSSGRYGHESSGCSSHFATLNNVTQGSQPSQPPPRSTEFQSSEDINRSVQLNHTTMNTPSENVVAPHLTHNGSSTQSSNVFWNSNGFRFPQVNETSSGRYGHGIPSSAGQTNIPTQQFPEELHPSKQKSRNNTLKINLNDHEKFMLEKYEMDMVDKLNILLKQLRLIGERFRKTLERTAGSESSNQNEQVHGVNMPAGLNFQIVNTNTEMNGVGGRGPVGTSRGQHRSINLSFPAYFESLIAGYDGAGVERIRQRSGAEMVIEAAAGASHHEPTINVRISGTGYQIYLAHTLVRELVGDLSNNGNNV